MNNKKRPKSQITKNRRSDSLNQKGNSTNNKNKNLNKEKNQISNIIIIKKKNNKVNPQINKSQKKTYNNNIIKEITNNIKVINHNKDEKSNGNSDNLYDIPNEDKNKEKNQIEKIKELLLLWEKEIKNNYEKKLKIKDGEISQLQKKLDSTKINAFLKNNKNKKVLKKNNTNNNIIIKIQENKGELYKQIIEEFEKMEKEINKLEIEIKELKEELMKYKINFNSPALIGLNNVGATCFMNSTLQCLSQTKKLANYFLNEKNKEKIINNNIAIKNNNDLQLSPVYLELIQKLWDRNGAKSFSPNEFMSTIEKMNPLFKTGQAGDAKDFIIFILEQLHKELKMPVNFNNNVNSGPLNQYDKNNAFNNFFNDFKKDCSIISDLFFGFNETVNECLNCKSIYNSNLLNNPLCYNYGIFNVLIFPLEEVKNMKNSLMQYNNNFQAADEVSLVDCFIYNQKSELFTGENRNYCNICKQLFDSNFTSKIYISPNILILILNRGKGNIYNIKLNFSEVIDITHFVLQKDKPQINYILYGVITHIGQSGPNAHFVASCKSPVDDNWYRYNDSMVNPISDIQKEVINFGTPYILFYQKI